MVWDNSNILCFAVFNAKWYYVNTTVALAKVCNIE